MRFMLIHKSDANTESSGPPPPALMQKLGEFIGEMAAAGKVLSSEGLMPSATGARVRVSRGRTKIIDGPFAEAKELIGGIAIVKVDSKQEAVAIATRWMQIHADTLGPEYEGEGEVRQLFDFGG
jgi:hypothetical protein